MQFDYPQLINKFSLYIGAGMTVRRAWIQIVKEYDKEKHYLGERTVYEEMRYTMNELKNGRPESECYEAFGRRCESPVYRKFGMLLSQNLRKGTKGSKNLSRIDTDRAIYSVFGEYHQELMEQYHVLGIDLGYRTGNYEEENLIQRLHYYNSGSTDHQIKEIQYLTDQSGQAFREQVLAYMEQRYGMDLVKKFTGTTEKWEQTETEEFDMEKELQQEFIQELAEFFKIFGDATRIRILQTLLEGERNVGDLADVLEMSQSAVSHQLRVLRQNDLVKYRKEGKTVFYSLDDEHIRMVLEQGMTHLRHKRGYHE